MTINGKLDRAALPDPQYNMESGTAYTSPQNEVEQIMADIWSNLLGRERIGIHDNFFTLGGDSIKALQMAARLHKLKITLELEHIFNYPTIAELSQRAASGQASGENEVIAGEALLTPIQVNFFEQQYEQEHHRNQSVMLFSKEALEEQALHAATAAIAAHHDALRMVFKQSGGSVVAYNRGLDGETYRLAVFDLAGQSPSNVSERIEAEAGRLQAGFDLANGPLFQLGLFHTDEGDHLLIIIHHLVMDGVSWRIIFEDLGVAYEQALAGKPVQLYEKSHSFRTWAEQLHAYARSKEAARELPYWRTVDRHSIKPLPRQSDKPSRLKDSRTLSITLDETYTKRLLQHSHTAYNTEINDLLIAALGRTIREWTGHHDVAVSLEGHGREGLIKGMNITRTIGWFTTVYPVVLNMKSGEIGYQIKTVKDGLRKVPNKGIGYGILKHLRQEDGASESWRLKPEIGFNYMGQFEEELQQGSTRFTVSKEGMGPQFSPEMHRDYVLDWNGIVQGGKLTMTCNYSEEQYSEAEINRLLESYRAHLEQIVDHCANRTVAELTPSDLLFDDLTIEELEELGPDRIADICPLTPMQEGMLFQHLFDEQSDAYFTQMAFEIRGPLQLELLSRSFQTLIDRHETLRTVFKYGDGKKNLQIVYKTRQAHTVIEDLRGQSEAEQKRRIEVYKREERMAGFDLRTDLLIKFTVFLLADDRHAVLWSHHHILMDGWCVGVLAKEWLDSYESLLNGQEAKLGEVSPYSNYVRWMQRQDKEAALAYWREHLSGYSKTASILGRSMPEAPRRAVHLFRLDAAQSSELNRLSQRSQVTINIVMQALWAVLLQRYSGMSDVVFGSTVSGRPSEVEGIEQMIGLFINTIPVRVRTEPSQTFFQLIAQMQKEAVESTAYHYFPLYEVQAQTALKRELLNHLFVFENYPVDKELAAGNGADDTHIGGRISGVDVFEQTGYDLEIVVSPGAQIEVRLKYNAGVYDEALIQQLEGHWKEAAAFVAMNAHCTIADIPLLTLRERNGFEQAYRHSEIVYPKDQTIIALFEEQAARVPDRAAVTYSGTSLTYRELDERAEQAARALRAMGVGPERIVAVMMNRSAELIIGLLAVLKAGGAYLPIDPVLPAERKAYMLSDSGACLILTRSGTGEAQGLPTEEIGLDPILAGSLIGAESFSESETQEPHKKAEPDNLAYVIYTSGTTGMPKGVMLENRNVVSLIFGQNRPEKWFDFSEHDVWTMFHAIGFDMSVWEMYGALLFGGRLVIVPQDTVRSPADFRELLIQEKVTVLNQTPTAFQSLLREESKHTEADLGLRYIIFAGEALVPHGLKEWYAKYGDATALVNMYGITETTVHATYRLIGQQDVSRNDSPIGNALDSLAAYVLGPNRELLPIGVPGELYIAGAGVARGYLNRPDLTAERFLEDPFVPGQRMYKSGDGARLLPGGELAYLGRLDSQVKVRGYRIELSEIENRLLKHELVKEAAVAVRENAEGEKELCAYVLSINPVSVAQLRAHLAQYLPDYMLPSHFTTLERMPMTINGKLDRAALPAPQYNVESGIGYEAPRSERERVMADIWSALLGHELIGIHDNFFALGGDSIKALQLSSRLNKQGYRVEIKDLFSSPTIAGLSECVVQEQADGEAGVIMGDAKLMPIQVHYFAQQYEERHHRNQAVMLLSGEPLQETALRSAAAAIAAHHDALRMVFKEDEQGVATAYNRGLEGELYKLAVIDLRGVANVSEQIEAEAGRLQAGFDLASGPLFQLGWFRTDDGDHLLFVIHHLVVDGVSWRILFEDLGIAYDQALAEAEIRLQAKSHSFRTWAERLHAYAQSRDAARELTYWRGLDRRALQPLPRRSGQASKLKDSRTLSFKLDPSYTKRLLHHSHGAYNTEINDLLLTALGLTIHKWTGQDEVAVSLEGHGREDLIPGMNVTRTVGWFTTLYPVVLEVKKPDDVGYQIKTIKDVLRKVPNKGIGYGLLKYLRQGPGTEEPWLMQPEIVFNYMGQYDEDLKQGRFELSRESMGPEFSPEMKRDYALDWSGMVQDGQLSISCGYSLLEFEEEEIARLLRSYRTQLEAIVDHCTVQEAAALTPGDLLYDELTIEELDDLVAELGDILSDGHD